MMVRILRLHLGRGAVTAEELPEETRDKWIGGRGLGGRLLLPHCQREWQDPASPIIVAAGPLAGIGAPSAGHVSVVARSPLTGTIGDGTAGGDMAAALRRAGWDAIVIAGRAKGLVGVEISDSGATVCEADTLAGATTREVGQRLAAKGSVACVGPAAESGCLFANVLVDGAPAGRNGLGAAFAAKNLKYVAVQGLRKLAPADPALMEQAREAIHRQMDASPALTGEVGISQYGEAALYDLTHARRMMPTANFRRTRFDPAPALNAPALKRRYGFRRVGCEGCRILCGKVGRNGEPMPGLDALSHFTALVENDDLDAAVRANAMCLLLGMDPVSAASTLACWAEVEGAALPPSRLLAMLEEMGRGRGEGRELAQGSLRFATARGRPEASMSVKGQELPACDPRGAYGLALAYAVSARGGCHLSAYPISHEILRKPVATDRFTFEGKARMVKIAEDTLAAADSLGVCKLAFLASSLEEYAKVLEAATGIERSAQELLRAGERVCAQERRMNALNGFGVEDDDLPARFFEQPGSSGDGVEIPPINRAAFLRARGAYHRIRANSRM